MKHTSRLLFNEEPITINRLAARVIGLNEAIVIQQVHYWLEINRKANINQYDNRIWTYNTYEKWQNDNFDFWSVITLKRIFKKLFDKGILIKGNYNVKKYDRTLWISIDYDKLDTILDEYEKNVVISTEYQNDTIVQTLKNEQNIKMIQWKVSKCYNGKYQNDTMESIKMIQPIPETTKETTKEISITTQLEDKPLVVETNKELIESKTHLLLDSKNKRDKVAKWHKDRLSKAITIFVGQEGQYFSLLEKIYKDDKNFAPSGSDKSRSTFKNRAHNVNNTFNKYEEEELEKLLFKSQEEKLLFKSQEEKFENIKADILEPEITEEIANKCRASKDYFNTLNEATKSAVKEYVSKNCMYIPLHLK